MVARLEIRLTQAEAALRAESAAHARTREALERLKRSIDQKVQADVADALHHSRRYEAALAGTDVVAFEQDEALTFTWAANIGAELEAAYPQGLVGLSNYTQVKGLPESLHAKEQVLATGEPFKGVLRHELPGRTLYYKVHITPTELPGGRRGIVGAATDITTMKEHEMHLQTVMRELTHRSKNLLAVVQSISTQTLRSAASAGDFNESFTARLRALANAHDLIAHAQWHGASVSDLAKRQLLHLIVSYPGRIRMSGPQHVLEPEVAQYVGLALHELGTNAVKYGALACEDGVITLTWSFDYNHFHLEWCEQGSIPEQTTPPRKGFGRMLLEHVVPKAAGGFAELSFTPHFCWRLNA